MGKLNLVIILSFLLSSSFAQSLARITIDNSGNSTVISFLVDETVLVNVSEDGKIIEWGTEDRTQRADMYPGILEKYMGKEEYYPSTDNEAYRGKIKYIGRALITYYSSDENAALKGKIKNIGPSVFDYYMDYDDPAFKGKLRDAGTVSFTYYRSSDNEAYKGKLKSVGFTNLTYYGSFDDKAYKGKIKNIDRAPFIYYSSYDAQGYGGVLKTGSRIVYSGNVKYLIKN